MTEDEPKSIELEERVIAEWFIEAHERFKELERKSRLYSDSEEFSAQELTTYLDSGHLSGEKRFESVSENDRRLYELLLESLEVGTQVIYIMDVYRKLFPDSKVVQNPKIHRAIDYVKKRCERLKPLLIDKICYRDELMRGIRGKD